jgi:hypothetical protein
MFPTYSTYSVSNVGYRDQELLAYVQ